MASYFKNFLISILFISTPAYSLDHISVGTTHSYKSETLEGLRLGLQWQWDRNLVRWKYWQLSGYWEASYHYVHAPNSAPEQNDRLQILAVTPVFVVVPTGFSNWRPYLEFAIGAAYFSDTEIAGRATGSRYQFEDRIALGARFGARQQYDLNLRLMHYSNAGINDPNPGYDMLMLTLTVPLTL